MPVYTARDEQAPSDDKAVGYKQVTTNETTITTPSQGQVSVVNQLATTTNRNQAPTIGGQAIMEAQIDSGEGNASEKQNVIDEGYTVGDNQTTSDEQIDNPAASSGQPASIPTPGQLVIAKPTNQIRILVLGPSGSGKSSFVAAATEQKDDVEIGHNADTCTHDCKEYPTKYSSGRNQIFLIDTPGFENRKDSNFETLNKIARIVKGVSGVVYLHRCTDIRFDADVKLTFEIIKAMCGPRFYSRVVICSTFWNIATSAQSQNPLQSHRARVESFLDDPDAFGEVMTGGATYREFWQDSEDPCSDILSHFLAQRNPPQMAIQDGIDKDKKWRWPAMWRRGWDGLHLVPQPGGPSPQE